MNLSIFFQLWFNIKEGHFSIEELKKAIDEIENSTVGASSQDDFKVLFSDLDLNSKKLVGVAERGDTIANILLQLADIDFEDNDMKIDVLGDAYEYLIGQFVANAGEFYTP